MSCGCENDKRKRDLERMRTLAKKLAKMQGEMVALYKEGEGYNFDVAANCGDKTIIEYISKY